MIAKTHAIALRIHAYSRTSHVVTWLTPEFGRVVTSVKGACRPKSAFLGQYDVGYRCELLFYRREHEGVHAARECTPLAFREALRGDWRSALAAGYACDLVARVTQPMLAAADLFHLLDTVLDSFGPAGLTEPLLLWFELSLLRCLGLAPNLESCPRCEASGSNAPQRFALASGRIVCAHSAPVASSEPTVSVNAALLHALRRFQSIAQPMDIPPGAAVTIRAVGMRRFLGMFLQCHLETPLAARRALFMWLDLDLAALRGIGEQT